MREKNNNFNHSNQKFLKLKCKINTWKENMETKFSIILVSVENFENALQISRVLIHEKLAACCSIVQNATSIFEWNGKFTERNESIIIVKTTTEHIAELFIRIKELHPDSVPEIISIPIEDGLPEYLKWVEESTRNN